VKHDPRSCFCCRDCFGNPEEDQLLQDPTLEESGLGGDNDHLFEVKFKLQDSTVEEDSLIRENMQLNQSIDPPENVEMELVEQ